MEYKFILASSSPRRIAIMREKGVDPVVMPPSVDETIPEGMKPADAVMFLALKKALDVEGRIACEGYAGNIIIAADTVVVKSGVIIGKPSDSREARRILETLRNDRHTVLTGVALIWTGTLKRRVFYDSAEVFFKNYSDEEILEYVNTPEPYDKAGGYAVQGTWGRHVERIEGDFYNVVGFPWEKILANINTPN